MNELLLFKPLHVFSLDATYLGYKIFLPRIHCFQIPTSISIFVATES